MTVHFKICDQALPHSQLLNPVLGLPALVLGSRPSALSWCLRWMLWLTLLMLLGGDVQGLL